MYVEILITFLADIHGSFMQNCDTLASSILKTNRRKYRVSHKNVEKLINYYIIQLLEWFLLKK